MELSLGQRRSVEEIARRKLSQLKICVTKDVQARFTKPGFEDVHLVHRALPEIDYEEVDLSMKILGHELKAPMIISGMTGGIRQATKINAALAEAAEKFGIGMEVGSQRIAIENPKLAPTFKIAREKAPTSLLIANIGCLQLAEEVKVAEEAIEMIDADALAIHLNPLQEAIQAEGDVDFRGVLESIEKVAKSIRHPVIVKETGAGICAENARMLEKTGIWGIDVSGAGGTSWSAVEYYRAKEIGDKNRERLGLAFWDWGIPTVASMVEVRRSTGLSVIGSGGIRSGVDMAKAIALGADATGIAYPLLKSAMKGSSKVIEELQSLMYQLKTAMFLVGSRSIQDLQRAPVIITGKTAQWLSARGFRPETYARRSL